MTAARPRRRTTSPRKATPGLRTYNSPSMLARRQRILREVLRLIEEGGVENITVRELATRSEVSPRTLYAAFGGKEELIAQAVKQHFPEAMGENGSRTIPDSLSAVAARLDLLAHVVIRERKYSAAMARIYFSPTIDHRIYEVLKEIALSHIRPWVTILVAEKRLSLVSPVQVELLLSQLANVEYTVINDWSSGRLTDAQLAPCLKLAAFCLIAGNLHDSDRPQIAAVIDRLWHSVGSDRR